MKYRKQDGLRHYFEKKVKGEESDVRPGYDLGYDFPGVSCDWLDKFCSFEEYIAEYHKNVNLAMAVVGDGLLTDHGPEHINSVMRHVVDIMPDPMWLTGYEMYILMYAIHFHDLGNITGRLEHEKKIGEVMAKLDDRLPLSKTEREVTRSIAMSHGGYIDDDKDTIKYVDERYYYGGASIRPKVLAAILRFADEVSDDLSRSDFEGVNVPDRNKIFHAYSKSLTPISVKGNTIKLAYSISYEQTQEKIPGPKEAVYLYDEILKRLEKMMIELEYCRKYAEGIIRITTLDIEIHIYKGEDVMRDVIPPFRLTLQGYPDRNYANLEYYREKTGGNESKNVIKYATGEELRKNLCNI